MFKTHTLFICLQPFPQTCFSSIGTSILAVAQDGKLSLPEVHVQSIKNSFLYLKSTCSALKMALALPSGYTQTLYSLPLGCPHPSPVHLTSSLGSLLPTPYPPALLSSVPPHSQREPVNTCIGSPGLL